MDDERRLEGKVVFFGKRGFGFLRERETRQDYFFHASAVEEDRPLRQGDFVMFTPTAGPRGLAAVCVRKIRPEPRIPYDDSKFSV
jgi:cold shock CspA family protein